MRAFLVFSCVILAVTARPDVSLGYKYPQPGGSSSDHAGLVAPSPSGLYAPSYSESASGSHLSSIGSLGAGISSGPAFSSGPGFSASGFSGTAGLGGASGLGGVSGFGSSSSFGSGGGGGYHHAPIITKHFYLHAAPEEQQDQVTKHITIGHPQKNYRVVFIKAPATNSVAPRISASYAPSEEKTIIYVLSKKPDDINIGEVATPAPTEPSKPEVFFIKYKTSEEAAHAQQKIQAQYDALGGTSQFTDEGTAQVSSVIGSLGGNGGNGDLGAGSSSGSQYLPPSH